MHTEQTSHTYIAASTAHTPQTHPTDTTYPHPSQTLQTHRHNPRDTTHTPTLNRHTHPANTPPQPMLISNRSCIHPLLTESIYTLTLSQAHTHSYTADTTHTHTHPTHTMYKPTCSHVLCHIYYSWWPCTWYDTRKLRSPHQAAPKCMRRRALYLHNLPDEITKQEEEIPLLLGCRTLALAQFCHCRNM